MTLDQLREKHGTIFPITLPSGKLAVLREQNGNDDDIISRAKDNESNTAILKFLASITVGLDAITNVTPQDIAKLRTADRYALLVYNRINSLSPTLIFSYKWNDKNPLVEYEVNLQDYIVDYSKPFDPEVTPLAIKPIDNDIMAMIKVGDKELRYTYSNGYQEAIIYKTDSGEFSKNMELTIRDLEIKQGDQWVKVGNFSKFTPRDMMAIRKHITENDPAIDLTLEITNPYFTKGADIEKVGPPSTVIAVYGVPEFFFPTRLD